MSTRLQTISHRQTLNTAQLPDNQPGGLSTSRHCHPMTASFIPGIHNSGSILHTLITAISNTANGDTVCTISAGDTGDTFTSMQPLPRLQQPLSSRNRILTLPEHEHRWQPIPPEPKTSSMSTDNDTMICDSLFIAPITPSITKYCTSPTLKIQKNKKKQYFCKLRII